MNKICPFCNKDLLAIEQKFMLAFENPYMNIFVHREHWSVTRDELIAWAEENKKELSVIYNNSSKAVKYNKKSN
jgi:hypothetical protein